MSRLLTLELSEDVYRPLARTAAASGQSLEEWAVDRLRRSDMSPEEYAAALARLLQHAGAVDLGRPTGANNENIDADLAREFGDAHEDSH
ncbi:MAG TPA: hypothetical protein VK395_21795 [Gemmataceae bacterium]|nr:hypothetical protein [Gemmataceae bacterium]